MTHNLWPAHKEYWKTLRRTNIFGEPYTIGFSWFATFPTSKRLRWPVGKAEKVLPWVCTQKQLMAEPDLTATLDNGSKANIEELPLLLWRFGGLREPLRSDWYEFHQRDRPNHHQGWDRYGMEIKGEMR